MRTEKKWLAVYTRPRMEKKVAEQLTRKRVDHFLPLNKVPRRWADRRKVIDEPLFTSYVFVYACEKEFVTIKQTDGIINFVYWLGNPAVIREEEIEAIRKFLAEHKTVQLEKVPVSVADRVRITDGVLMHREGDVMEVKSKTVKVYLPSLGYAISAEVSKSRIEVLNYESGKFPSPDYRAMKAV